MSAKIVMNDGGGPVTGSIEVTAQTTVTLSNLNNTGVNGWLWTLKDKPTGSAATLSATTTATCTIEPDLPGEYLVELITYTDAARTVFDGSDTQACGVRHDAPLNWLIPAAGQTTQRDSLLGWKVELNKILSQIRAAINGPGGILKFSGGFDQTPNQPMVFADTGPTLATAFVSSNAAYVMPTAGTIRQLRVSIPSNTLTKDLAIVVYKNGVSQTLQVSVPSTSTGQFSDIVNSFTVVPGDRIHVQGSCGTGGGLAVVYITMQVSA